MSKEIKAVDSPIYDLANRTGRSVVAVIDTVTARGGFRGEELTTIGNLRDQAMQLVKLAEEHHSEF
jgi:hypothetical protein